MTTTNQVDTLVIKHTASNHNLQDKLLNCEQAF